MEGLERLETEVLEMNNNNISAIFEYLKTRKGLYEYFNNEEKHIKQMYEYMCDKAKKQKIGQVAMISDQMVYLWAVSYFTKSNEELGIKENKKVMPPSSDEVIKNIEKKNEKKEEKAPAEDKPKDSQITLFEGVQK